MTDAETGSITTEVARDAPADEPRRAPAPTGAPGAPSVGALTYTPALDGIRALAVLAVLAFHGGVPGFGGGFLGVSTFFTLSGFLITSLLLVHVRHPEPPGRSMLGSFWGRRVRRLVPAALVGIALATAVTMAVGTGDNRRALPGDVLSALGEVANWRFLASGQSYGALFAEPSALLHHWSLAIEEQFYLVVPLVVVLALRWRSPRRRLTTLTVAVVGLLVLSIASSLRHLGEADRLYYGSDTRAAELLLGCLLAIVVFSRGGTARVARHPTAARMFAVGGALALVASVAAWVLVDRGDPWLQPGGLLLYATLSCLLVLGGLVRGPQSRLLSVPLLLWIGQRSYGIYVLHWPLFVLLDESRTGLDGVALFALRVAVSVGAAALLFVVVEQPIRHRTPVPWLPRRRLPLGAALVAAILIAILVVPPAPVATNIDFASAEAQFQDELARLAPPSTIPPAATDAAPSSSSDAAPGPAGPRPPLEPPWLVVVGDEAAAGTSYAVLTALEGRHDAHAGGSAADRGCSLLRATTWRDLSGEHRNPARCEDRATTWRRAADASDADVVLVQIGRADLGDHGIEGRWAGLGDPEVDRRLAAELDRTIADLEDDGRVVVLTTVPTDWAVLGKDRPWELDEAEYRARATRFNQLVVAAAAAHHGRAAVLDVDRWHREHGDGVVFRPNGIDTDPVQTRALTTFVLDSLVTVHRLAWEAAAPSTTAEPSSPAAATPLRVLVVGDSTALPFAVALHGRSSEDGDVEVASVARSNCGLARGGRTRDGSEELDVSLACGDWEQTFADAVDRFRPDVVLLVDSVWELGSRLLPGDVQWRSIGDPTFDAYLRSELEHAVAVLHRTGAPVALVRYPRLDLSRFEAADPNREAIDEDTGLRRLNLLLDTVAAGSGGAAATIDLATAATAFPAGDLDPERRPDGVHFTEPAARDILDAWLLDQLLAVAGRTPS